MGEDCSTAGVSLTGSIGRGGVGLGALVVASLG